jgi:hypothetical protein
MRLGLAVVLLCTGTTALANSDELDLPGLDAADMRGDAMVWEDAPLYLEPWEGGASIKYGYISRRRDEPGRAMAVRIVDSSLRNFVEIAVPGRADCSWRKIDVDPRIEGLRLFVRRSDLAPVLVKPYSATYPDGTRIKLGVGMPVTPANGEYNVGLKGDRVTIRLSIPHSSVGYVYKAPGKISDADLSKEKVVRIDRNITLKVGEDSFQVRGNWYAPAPEKKTDTALVKINMRCLEMVASAPSSSLRSMEMPKPYVSTPGPQPPLTGWRIPAGAPLSTASGREVAVASKDIQVTMPSPAPDTVCFDARTNMIREDETYGTRSQPIRLCAPGNVVEK